MEYISAREAAEIWGITQRRVATLCSEGRICGAEILGNMWLIPKDTEKPVDKRSERYTKDAKVKPFVKWVGGKGQLIEEIRKKYPKELGESINKYAEPFVGGGAVLFDVLSNYKIDEVFINDSNFELMNTYLSIRDDVEELISMLDMFESEFIPMNIDDRKNYYYIKRKRFNDLKKRNKSGIELSALFIFINRTCFNGLYRVNKNGEYNVPMGAYSKPCICDKNNLRRVSDILQNVIINCGDYHDSSNFIDENTFVYFDPPYRPLTTTSSFTSYTENDFSDKDQIELARYICELADRGACVVASNSDPKNTDDNDCFFDDLYSKLKITRVYASRVINSKASGRGRISELLISNY